MIIIYLPWVYSSVSTRMLAMAHIVLLDTCVFKGLNKSTKS